MTNVNYWWVSQNQTFNQEFNGGYMWSPKVNTNGGYNHFYENMTKVMPGDIVLSYKGTYIVAVGVIQATGYTSNKPDELESDENNWSSEGWRVDVEYHLLTNKIRPADHMPKIKPWLPEKYSPLKSDGGGNQAYLFHLPDGLVDILTELIGDELRDIATSAEPIIIACEESAIEAAIEGDLSIQETEKKQLVSSRRGQGLFRSRLEVIEPMCRITRVSTRSHLIASHIKPWRSASNAERLDGNNGLLLAPHIDHLFDKGYISFENNGDLIVSECIPLDLLTLWSIDCISVGSFNVQQQHYLDHHRKHIFKTIGPSLIQIKTKYPSLIQ